jgi:hypothetical protein
VTRNMHVLIVRVYVGIMSVMVDDSINMVRGPYVFGHTIK